MTKITQADRDAANELIAVLFYDEAQEHINAEAIARNFARHRTTSLAAQDGLVEALELVQKLIADAFEQIAPLKRQGEDKIWQPASTACVMLWEARDRIAALSAIKGDKS